ncbi:MAG TPA: hypothetical protein VGE10_00545 [Zeimonas sp.]
MSKPRHNAFTTERVTDGVFVAERWNIDLAKRLTPDDRKALRAAADAGSPRGRLQALEANLRSIAKESSPAIQLHAEQIRRHLADLAHLLDDRNATYDELQALREAELSWRNVLLVRDMVPLARRGRKFEGGRKLGAVGPIRKAIRRLLKNDPTLKNADLWDLVKARLPRGWTAFDNRTGRYLEKPSRPEQKQIEKVEYSTFCNIAADERKALKGS